MLKDIISHILYGIYDSISIHLIFVFYLRNNVIMKRISQCFILNGGLFVGSILFVNYVLIPLVLMPISSFLISHSTSFSITSIQLFISFIYNILWVYPIYILSFILNSIWYKEIAEEGLRTESKITINKFKNEHKFKSILYQIAGDGIKLLNMNWFFLQSILVSYIPYIGNTIYILHLALFHSMCCFDYRWSSQNITWNQRKLIMHSYWPYFLGFGLTPAILQVYIPSFVGTGLYAMIYPIFILLSVKCDHIFLNASPVIFNSCFFSFPFLEILTTFNNFLLRTINIKTRSKMD
jgi:etoposide-induced 2.4 mRNA